MDQSISKKATKLIITILQWFVTNVLILCFIGSLAISKAYLSAACFLIAAILIMPALEEFRNRKLPFLNNRFFKISLIVILFFIGGAQMKRGAIRSSPLNHKYGLDETTINNFGHDVPDKVMAYIEKNRDKMIYRNMDTLIFYQSKFKDEFLTPFDLQSGHLEINPLNHTATYKPFISDTLLATYFLKPIEGTDNLKDYQLIFHFISDTITKAEAIAYWGSKTLMMNEQDRTDFSKLLMRDMININQAVIDGKKQSAAFVKNSAEKKSKFESECLSSWDGSCTALTEYIKKNMNDPESFEHVETTYKLKVDYAIVRMKYRGKNSFGAKVLGTVDAQVNYSCEVISISELR